MRTHLISLGLLWAVACTQAGPAPAVHDLSMTPPRTDGPPPDLRMPRMPPDLSGTDPSADLLSDDPYACASGSFWTLGDLPGPNMHPGMACDDCHQRRGVPLLTIAGTVYPRAHEPDDCLGPGAIAVEITDGKGTVATLTTNSNGNFATAQALTPPYRARVLYMGRVGQMLDPQMTGDCNICHTQDGANGAPGRILVP